MHDTPVSPDDDQLLYDDPQKARPPRGLHQYSYLMRWWEPRWFKKLRSRGLSGHDEDHQPSSQYHARFIREPRRIPGFPVRYDTVLRWTAVLLMGLLYVPMGAACLILAVFASIFLESLVSSDLMPAVIILLFLVLLIAVIRFPERLVTYLLPERVIYAEEDSIVISHTWDYLQIAGHVRYITYKYFRYYINIGKTYRAIHLHEHWKYAGLRSARFEEVDIPESGGGYCLRLVHSSGTELLLGMRSGRDVEELSEVLHENKVPIQPPVVWTSFEEFRESIQKQPRHNDPSFFDGEIRWHIIARFRQLYNDLLGRQPDRKGRRNKRWGR